MKILLVVDDFSGGAGNVIQILANEFTYRGYDVTILLLNYHTQSNLLDKRVTVIKNNINYETPNNKILWIFKTIKKIKMIIMKLMPSVVISFLDNNNTLVGLSLILEKINFIVSERSNPVVIKPKGFWRILRIPAYFKANQIIVQCPNFVNFNKLFSRKTYVIPNPVINPYININRDFKNKKVKFVSLGRLAKIKQFDLMLKVFARINNKYPNTELYIYGEGKERNNLKYLIEQLHLEDKAFLMGRTNKVHDVLNNYDVYLMTSKQEGFPNALCEAMATGLPAVAFECHEGLRNIVDNGINGFLVSPNNIDEMVACASLLIEDCKLRLIFSENAMIISEKYSVKNVVNMWEETINKFCGGK